MEGKKAKREIKQKWTNIKGRSLDEEWWYLFIYLYQAAQTNIVSTRSVDNSWVF